MYSRRLSQPFPSNPNLKILLLENKNAHELIHKITFMIRRISTVRTLHQNVADRVQVILKKSKLLGYFKSKLSSVPKSLKDQSASVLQLWAHQCECVVAQRLRRGQQMFCLYSRLWEERALREFIQQMRRKIGIKGRDWALGALGVTTYNWQTNRIPESDIKKHSKEMDYVSKLKDQTLCNKCNKNSTVCPCHKGDSGFVKTVINTFDEWKVFIEKNELVVWRRPHSSGNFEYKVYGSYPDVSAEDFLNVQIDIEYRKRWDTTAVALSVVETDPDPKSNSDIVYWEMLWPTLFANRDYVFNRRYLVDYQSKTLFLVSQSTKHPSCPKDNTKYRIEDYWSYMVIKPYSDLNKPGIEFSLTYFDNPGVNIPASVTTWVAMKAMPDFLERLRDASRKYKKYCQESGVCQICNITDTLEARNLYPWDYFEDEVTDNTIYEARFKVPSSKAILEPIKLPQLEEDSERPVMQQNTQEQPESHSFWRYLHPTYYFS